MPSVWADLDEARRQAEHTRRRTSGFLAEFWKASDELAEKLDAWDERLGGAHEDAADRLEDVVMTSEEFVDAMLYDGPLCDHPSAARVIAWAERERERLRPKLTLIEGGRNA